MEPPDTYTRAEVLDLLGEIERRQREREERLLERLRSEMMALHLGDDKLLNRAEAAYHLNVSIRTVDRLRSEGELKGGKIGGVWMISMGEIRAYSRDIGNGKHLRLT